MFTRWPMADMQNEMRRLQNELDVVFGRSANQARSVAPAFPALNVWQSDDNYVVEAELPGMELNDLEILVDAGNQLTIKGERKSPSIDDGTWHRRERAFGRFHRTMELPSMVDADRVSATLKDGVLTITLPKPEKEKPRRIVVKAN